MRLRALKRNPLSVPGLVLVSSVISQVVTGCALLWVEASEESRKKLKIPNSARVAAHKCIRWV